VRVRSPAQRPSHDRLRLLDDGLQVLLALEALGVQLVDVLGARRAGGETSRLPSDVALSQTSGDPSITSRSFLCRRRVPTAMMP